MEKTEVDAYQAYVEQRRARQVPDVEVQPLLTDREAKLLVELVDLTHAQFKTEQAMILRAAATKIGGALARAIEATR